MLTHHCTQTMILLHSSTLKADSLKTSTAHLVFNFHELANI